MRILVADDDPDFCHILQERLVKWGYDVVVAQDGNEAWQAMQAADVPQIAILDWMMPEMDGVEVCRKIRQERPEPYTYVILLTSLQKVEDLVTGMEAGADDYITKPYKTDELRVRLNAGRRIIKLQNELCAHAAELEAANRDLESFSYTVANDLLKSLLSIGENAKLVQDLYCSKLDEMRSLYCSEPGEMCSSYTQRIYEQTKTLGQLIGIMHDFFRPTRIKLHRETIDLSAMAGETAENFRLAAPERRVAFRIADGIKVNADRALMQIVLNNLMDNAWKHTGTREEPVIEFGETSARGETAYFLRDNGTGFDMADADQLFRPFQRLTGTEKLTGQGIGLATVERIIRRHGGRVWAKGEPGAEATFYFTLSCNQAT